MRAGSGGLGWAKRGREGAGHVRCGASTLSRLYVGGKAARDELWTAAEGIGVLKCKQVECKAV